MSHASHTHVLRLGTRGSLLARAQSGQVARELESRHPGLRVELIPIKTSGDRITERPLHEFGGKGLFTKELEQALLAGQIDFAVHSFKDVPVTMPLVDQADLTIAAVPTREDPRDVLVCDAATGLAELLAGARVGTGSLRRRCQVLDRRPDLRVDPIRGNIDTRLKKLDAGEFDAVILALAGVKRAGLFDRSRMHPIGGDDLLPAPGQGALALQCRRNDARTIRLLHLLDDAGSAASVGLERALVRLLNGDCHSPIAAFAQIVGEDRISLRAAVGGRDGAPPVARGFAVGSMTDPEPIARAAFEQLRGAGIVERLH